MNASIEKREGNQGTMDEYYLGKLIYRDKGFESLNNLSIHQHSIG